MRAFSILAGGEGFEPPLAESESAVLPLDDPPVVFEILQQLPDLGEGLTRGYAARPTGALRASNPLRGLVTRAFGPRPPGRIASRFCLSARFARLGANPRWRSQSPQSYH